MAVKVILLKGTRGERVFENTTARLAAQRADALCHLHGVRDYTWSNERQAYIVDASHFYTDKPHDPMCGLEGFLCPTCRREQGAPHPKRRHQG